MKKIKITIYILIISSHLFFLQNQVNAEEITTNTIISTDTTYDSLVIKNGATLTLDAVLTVNGDAIIQNGGILTHTGGTSTNFDLQVGGTLTIDVGGKIDVTGKGNLTTGAGTSSIGGTHGGYGYGSTKLPYDDIYNPIMVGSYGATGGRYGGGLIRMTVSNLINSGSILANGNNYSLATGAGGSINITVNGNISGSGVYQANGGTSSDNYHGGGGRIAIKYNSVDDFEILKSKISATGPGASAGEGTIYLKDNTSGDEFLIIKGDGGNLGTRANIDLNTFKDVIIDGGGLTLSGTVADFSVPKSFEIKNGGFLSMPDNTLTISGTLNLYNSNLTVNQLLIKSDLNITGGILTVSDTDIDNNLSLSAGTINTSGLLSIAQNATIKNLGIITHPIVTVSSFNLIVGGTLEIQVGGKIDVTGKGNLTTGAGTSSIGGTHGGYGYGSTKLPYDDIYNPIMVGSYGATGGRYGGGLIRMTVSNLINSGSILANGNNYSHATGAGGSLNIIVNGNISGSGVYQANGGTSSDNYHGGGGRIAIKYNSVDDFETLKSKIFATGLGSAGEGTIYLKDNTTSLDYLLVKGDSVSTNKNTGVGTGYTDYYFDTIEVTNYAKLYKIGAENIFSSNCLTSGSGVIDPIINCTYSATFRYYDLGVTLKRFNSINRKYEFIIDGPNGGGSFATSSTGIINGNGSLYARIKLSKLGLYNFKFNLYDGILEDSQIYKTAEKNVQVNSY